MERLNTFTLPRLTPSQRVSLGNTIAIICVIVVIAQFYFQDLPLYVYAIELLIPITIISYNLTKKPTKKEKKKPIAKSVIIKLVNKANLSPEEREPIDEKIAKNNIAAAYQELSDILDYKENQQNEIEKIKEKAKEARCFGVILHYFEDGGNDLKVARKLITTSRIVRNQAKILGIVKEVNADLESGDLEEAKAKVAKVSDEKWKETRKKNSLSILEEKINKLEDDNKKTELQEKLERLKEFDYGTEIFQVGRNDLSENILREQTAQVQRVW